MSPTPVTFATPTQPSAYSWEATNDEVARRYGIPVERIVRFDLNTFPAPPAAVADVLAAGRFELSLSEYPPSDYARLIAVAAERYGVATDDLLVGAGADEILDDIVKAFLAPGDRAILPIPTYAMYRVLTEQRDAVVVPVPRLGAAAGWALDLPAMRAAAADAALVWLCSPNNPTAQAEPDGTIDTLLRGLADDAAAAGRPAPIVVLDEAYAEFVGSTLAPLRSIYPNLISIRTISKAYALAGLRVGFAIARPAVIERLNLFRPPGSVSIVSVTVATAVLASDAILAANLAQVVRERPRLTAALTALGWSIGPSVTNFLLADLGTPERAADVAEGLLRQGVVPRTFPAGHPCAAMLRLSVRDPDQNDRLIAAAAALTRETSP